MLDLPRYIALCGHPGSGKTAVQQILQDVFDVQPVDDGYCLRHFAMQFCGASQDDVYTQEGKLREARMPGGKIMIWRKFLGEFGNAIEALLGPDAIPEIAIMAIYGSRPEGGRFSFGSVRREQGRVFKAHGGIVIGIRRPGVEPSKHEFDRFNEELVDFWIDNDGSLEILEKKVAALMTTISFKRQLAVHGREHHYGQLELPLSEPVRLGEAA